MDYELFFKHKIIFFNYIMTCLMSLSNMSNNFYEYE